MSLPEGALAHNGLTRYQAAFHEWSAVVAYSPRTIAAQKHALGRFIAWADARGLTRPQDITRPILERYQRHLYHYRKHNGEPLAISAQLGQLLPLQAWFKWLTKQNHILYNPAADLDLPARPKALPKGLLTIAQVEALLNHCDTATLEGLRLRAMFEVFYSTGIRRFELAGLKGFESAGSLPAPEISVVHPTAEDAVSGEVVEAELMDDDKVPRISDKAEKLENQPE